MAENIQKSSPYARRITTEEALAIREAYTASTALIPLKELAARFNTTVPTVRHILRGNHRTLRGK